MLSGFPHGVNWRSGLGNLNEYSLFYTQLLCFWLSMLFYLVIGIYCFYDFVASIHHPLPVKGSS